MTPVKILRTFKISLDGINVQTWPAGSKRSVDDATLDLLIAEGACEIVEAKAHVAAPENKARRSKPRKAKE
jgi:hypothetical protein